MHECLGTVDIKAIIAAETFKTQNYYRILCELLPELTSSRPGHLCSKQNPNLSIVIIDSEKTLP